MKKISAVILSLALMVNTVSAAIIRPGMDDPKPEVSTLTFDQFVHLSAKEVEKLTGKKLTLAQKMAFKATQKGLVKKADAAKGKSQLTAALLCFFLGGLGIHRFYLGYTWQGIVQLLTLGGLGIWALIDFIRILIGDLKPKDGEYAKKL